MTAATMAEGGAVDVLAAGECTVVVRPRLTVRKLAEKLKSLESSSSHGYALALCCVDLLDYDSLCALAELDDPENDPNLMPSRFLILPGATDEGLRAKGNLDDYPYPLGEGMPKLMSCQALGDFLAVAGTLNVSAPKWLVKESREPPQCSECDEELMDAFRAFAEGIGPLRSLDKEVPRSHEVEKGETLGAVAEFYGIRSWTLLWELNKDSLASPSAPLPMGMMLVLPAPGVLDTSDFETWIEDFESVSVEEQDGMEDGAEGAGEMADSDGFDPRTVLLGPDGGLVEDEEGDGPEASESLGDTVKENSDERELSDDGSDSRFDEMADT